MEPRFEGGKRVFVQLAWVMVAAVALALPGMARADDGADSRIDLSWRAAYGQPRAVDNIPMTCDTTLEDTLYLTLEPGKDSPTFIGFSATIYFHAPQGDTLAPAWHGIGGQDPDWITPVLDTDRNAAVAAPWQRGQSLNTWKYDVTSGSGRLRLVFGTSKAGSVRKDHRYVLARVLLRHPAKGPGCDQPICLEWQTAELTYDFGDEPNVNRGSRFVSWNGRGACNGYLPAPGPAPWKPKPDSTTKK